MCSLVWMGIGRVRGCGHLRSLYANFCGPCVLLAAGVARVRVIRGYVCVYQRDGWTPFRIAQWKGHSDVAAVLTEAGGR